VPGRLFPVDATERLRRHGRARHLAVLLVMIGMMGVLYAPAQAADTVVIDFEDHPANGPGQPATDPVSGGSRLLRSPTIQPPVQLPVQRRRHSAAL
jgi:hypothetical protein